jgi:hypothetical protein
LFTPKVAEEAAVEEGAEAEEQAVVVQAVHPPAEVLRARRAQALLVRDPWAQVASRPDPQMPPA